MNQQNTQIKSRLISDAWDRLYDKTHGFKNNMANPWHHKDVDNPDTFSSRENIFGLHDTLQARIQEDINDETITR